MRTLAALRDNAMLYKDLTQWIRSRTFQTFFLGLLFLSEILAVIMISIPSESRNLGAVTFSILCVMLGVYALGILGGAGNLTSREFREKTFELYEMAGMSLERMVFGKFFSTLCQFAFGFFCILPFMFFAYLLGGLDFTTIFITPLLFTLAVVPIYLLGLFLSLSVRSQKPANASGRSLITVLFMIFFVPWLLTGVLRLFFWHGRSPFSSFSFPSLSTTLFLTLAVVLLFYVLVCLLLFYLCCGAISRNNDSREIQVKTLLFAILIAWLLTNLYDSGRSPGKPEGVAFLAFVPATFISLVAGLAFYLNRLDTPLVVRERYRQLGRARQFVWRLFAPGARAGFRSQVLLFLITAGFALVYYVRACSATGLLVLPKEMKDQFLHPISVALQTPYFIVLPGALFLLIRKMNDKLKQVGVVAVVTWILLGVLTGTALSIFGRPPFYWQGAIEAIGLFLSPVSSFIAGLDHQSTMRQQAPMIRIALGILGLYMMRSMLTNRFKALPVPPATLTDGNKETWKTPQSTIPTAE